MHDSKGEAQNVNIDPESPGKLGGNDKDVEQARSKATEGMRQHRDDDTRSSNKNADRLNDSK
jgi:hypothetical protein